MQSSRHTVLWQCCGYLFDLHKMLAIRKANTSTLWFIHNAMSSLHLCILFLSKLWIYLNLFTHFCYCFYSYTHTIYVKHFLNINNTILSKHFTICKVVTYCMYNVVIMSYIYTFTHYYFISMFFLAIDIVCIALYWKIETEFSNFIYYITW